MSNYGRTGLDDRTVLGTGNKCGRGWKLKAQGVTLRCLAGPRVPIELIQVRGGVFSFSTERHRSSIEWIV